MINSYYRGPYSAAIIQLYCTISHTESSNKVLLNAAIELDPN